jgi:hypothetical protein
MRKKVVILGLIGIFCLFAILAVSVFAKNFIVLKMDCNKAREFIISDYKERLTNYEAVYENLNVSRNRVLNTISKLESEKFDVTILKTKFNLFNNKVKKFETDYKIFLNSLKELGESTCDKTLLENARKNYENQLNILNSDILDLKESSPDIGKEFEKVQKEVNLKYNIDL